MVLFNDYGARHAGTHLTQSSCLLTDIAYIEHGGGVPMVAIQIHCHVNVDDVAIGERPVIRNPMAYTLVDTGDVDGPVKQISVKSWLHEQPLNQQQQHSKFCLI